MRALLPLAGLLSTLPADRPALYDEDGEGWISYGALAARVRAASDVLARLPRSLAFLLFSNKVADVVAYLGLMSAGHVPALIDPGLPAPMRDGLIARYRPEILAGTLVQAPDGWMPLPGIPAVSAPDRTSPPGLHPDLGLLLTTSGSTGSPKMVCLSTGALAHNTGAIIEALSITGGDRAVGHMPLHYSFGLSILQTHLVAGGSVLLTSRSMVESDFWDLVRSGGATSLSGTPFHMRLIGRLGLDALDLPGIRVMTQAGGRFPPDLARPLHAAMAGRGGRYFVMYGQTEASPRLTTLPAASFPSHEASVGLPLHGGAIDVVDPDGRPLPPMETGEVLYRGPNVMMGYAETRSDLALGDRMGGVLRTGDLGHVDREGFLYLTGRANRFAKIAGLRINLDEVEAMAGAGVRVAAVERDGSILLFAERLEEAECRTLNHSLADRLRLSSRTLRVRAIGALPVTAKGKVDYARLRDMP
ncbi:MAG: AMP-binding protein [Telmatospirillum sp.]|nr:AMP-binding protein [Telmatospirillum sp.]